MGHQHSAEESGKSHSRIRPSGGYRTLRSFQVATRIYDATVDFCKRFVDARSRTVDQMVQAARSGRQNIAEGSRAAATSSQTELHLVNVARASLDELLLDYQDFLRQRDLPEWTKESKEALRVRALAHEDQPDPTDRSDPSDPYAAFLSSPDPAVVANTLICLIHQANYLLDRQVTALEKQFIQGGGYSERLAAERIAERQRQNQARSTTPADPPRTALAPNCPQCGKPMALRTARKGPNSGNQFWGCSGYPECKGTLSLDAPHND
jgi:four helix bundle suffix protein